MADLAPLAARRRATGGEAPHLNAAPEPGQLPVNDVAALANGSILLAHGDLGVRLVTIDGRTRARWDLPTHRLVVADHGGAALLLRTEGSVTEAHRLDLDSRRVTRWTAFAARYLLRSYDGGVLIVIDRDGLAFLDTLAGGPRVIWRELTEGFVVHDINRTPVSLNALITVPAEPPGEANRLELWQWELPSVTLRRRRPIVSPRKLVRAVAVGGQIVGLSPVGAGEYDLWREDEFGQRHIDRMVPQGSSLLADGDAYAIQTGASIAVVQRDDRSLRTTQVTFPTDQRIGLRLHAGTINLWDQQGRVVCVNPNDPANAVSLRTSM